MGWAADEFKEINLGDKRLNERMFKLCDTLSESPESPINQACNDWAETKAAYRFFQNDSVETKQILSVHRKKTAERAAKEDRVLVVQDTSYFIYSNHPKTKGLGDIGYKKGTKTERIYSRGLVMHASLAITDSGTPLGLIDQNIFARQSRSENHKNIRETLPVEEKESFRWIKALKATMNASIDKQVITICDRECDFYDFFKAAKEVGAPVLIRASQNRTVNRTSRWSDKNITKLWDLLENQASAGSYTIEVTPRNKKAHCKGRLGRNAEMSVKFTSFKMNPPKNNPKHGIETLSDITMYAVYALEKNPPEGEKPVEWMILTNMPVTTFSEAKEKVKWYSLRWRIEMFFKILKSGFNVESCRLGNADRLICYLTVMSIIAWRLFMITLIARTDPAIPCSVFLSDSEWKVLGLKVLRKDISSHPPNIAEAVNLIAKLGGFLGRKNDGLPGTLVLWRGWKKLIDLAEGWELAQQTETCG